LTYRWAVLAAGTAAQAAFSTVAFAIAVLAPALRDRYDLSLTEIGIVLSAEWIGLTFALLPWGFAVDRFGERWTLAGGLTACAGFLVAAAYAPSFGWLVAARVAQGLGAALISGSAPALVTLAVAPAARGRALGIYQMSMAAGFAAGPLLGGLLVDLFGWRAVFLFRLLPALLLVWLASAELPALRERGEAERFDLAGALTLALSLASLLLALGQSRRGGWSSSGVIALGVGFAVCFFGFIITERRARAPVVDLSLFRHVPFVIANLLAVLANCARFAVGLLVPYYVIEVLRYSAATGGTLMLAAARAA